MFCLMVFICGDYDFCWIVVNMIGNSIWRKVVKDNRVYCVNVGIG